MIKERKTKEKSVEKVPTKKKIQGKHNVSIVKPAKKKTSKVSQISKLKSKIGNLREKISLPVKKIATHTGSFKNLLTSKKNNKKALIGVIIVIIVVGAILNFCWVAYESKVLYKKIETMTMKAPTWIPVESFFLPHVKVSGAKQLPKGCNHWKDQCWKDAIANGTVKFIATPARVLLSGYEHRPIAFAYFKNTTSAMGITGYYNFIPIFLDDGTLAATDIMGGVSLEIDWVSGSNNGIVLHFSKTNECFEEYFDTDTKSWSIKAINCPIFN